MSGTNYEYLLEEYLNYHYFNKSDPNEIQKNGCEEKTEDYDFEVPF